MKIFRFSFLMLAATLMLAACGSNDGVSSATGWNYNDPSGAASM